MKGKFICENCGKEVPLKALGTAHRNHCPFCLWSKHLDKKSGDRKAFCGGLMTPIALTFKKEGIDKFTGKPRQGEIMIVHQCKICGKISINRIAGDDLPTAILDIFKNSLKISSELKNYLKSQGIEVLAEKDEKEIKTQLYGKFSKVG
ncbi:MAG: RNHCP domain-containing protein [Microgenomates group bacterium]